MIDHLTLPEIALKEKHSIKRGPFGGALKKEIFVEEGYAVYEQQHAIYKGFDSARYFIDEKKYKELESFKVEKGDLLISCSGTIGKIAEVPVGYMPGIINQALLKLSLNQEVVDNKYFIYLFESDLIQNQLFNLSHGSGLKNFPPMSVIKAIKFPLPPLATQKKIAAILDAADAYRQKTKQLLAKYDELAQSIFLEMFGDTNDEKISLSDLVEVNPKKSEISNLDKNTEVSFVPMADVSEEGDMNNTQIKKMAEVWSGFTYFKEDDVVFAKITPCMENGKGAIARSLVNGLGFGTTEFHVLRPIEGLSKSSWIFQLTHSRSFRKLAETNMTGSAGQKRVPKEFFSKFKISKPNYMSQIKFEKILQSIYSQKQNVKVEFDQAEKLFNSLLQKAFKGELVK